MGLQSRVRPIQPHLRDPRKQPLDHVFALRVLHIRWELDLVLQYRFVDIVRVIHIRTEGH